MTRRSFAAAAFAVLVGCSQPGLGAGVDPADVSRVDFIGKVESIEMSEWEQEVLRDSPSDQATVLIGPGSITLENGGQTIPVPARTNGFNSCIIGTSLYEPCFALGAFDPATETLEWLSLVGRKRYVGQLRDIHGRMAIVDVDGGPIVALAIDDDAIYSGCIDGTQRVLGANRQPAPVPDLPNYLVLLDEEDFEVDLIECLVPE